MVLDTTRYCRGISPYSGQLSVDISQIALDIGVDIGYTIWMMDVGWMTDARVLYLISVIEDGYQTLDSSLIHRPDDSQRPPHESGVDSNERKEKGHAIKNGGSRKLKQRIYRVPTSPMVAG